MGYRGDGRVSNADMSLGFPAPKLGLGHFVRSGQETAVLVIVPMDIVTRNTLSPAPFDLSPSVFPGACSI